MSWGDAPWWEADDGQLSTKILNWVSDVERAHIDRYERYARLACLYDPYDMSEGDGWSDEGRRADGYVSENLIARNIDSTHATITSSKVRSRYILDDAEWSEQRRMRRLEWYIEGIGKKVNRHKVCGQAAKEASLKGPGFVKVWADHKAGVPRVERVLADNVIWDDLECTAGQAPKNLAERRFVSKAELIEDYPEHEAAIMQAHRTSGINVEGHAVRMWAEWRHLQSDEIVIIEIWRRNKRHSIVIDGAVLLDEEWDRDDFPIERTVWLEKDKGWGGIGQGERVAGMQREVNRINRQEDAARSQTAWPTTYVKMADANLAVKRVTRFGTVVAVKADYPQTILPKGFSDEHRARRRELSDLSYEETGQNRYAATGVKPVGLDSGAALREYRSQVDGRHAVQEAEWERFNLAVDNRILLACKELGDSAPEIVKRSRFGRRRIDWGEVDPGELEVSVTAASTLPRTSAGRTQLASEWAQQGLISVDEWRRLTRYPDIEGTWSLWTAALEDVENAIEMIFDGEHLVPEPFQNLKLIRWRGQQHYLRAQNDGAPEHILEALREYVVQAAFIDSMQEPPMPQAVPDPMSGQPPPTPAMAPESMGVTPV